MTTIAVGKKCWCGGLVGATFEGGDIGCLEAREHKWNATGKRDYHTKLYIAGPMSGYPEANYPAFNDAERYLAAAGYEVVNPAKVVTGDETHYIDFLREDLRVMLDCHGVATLDYWWESTGARNEVQVGGLLRMPVRTVADWLARARVELQSSATTPLSNHYTN